MILTFSRLGWKNVLIEYIPSDCECNSFYLELTERPNDNFKRAFLREFKEKGINIFSLRNTTNKIFAPIELHWVGRLTILKAIKGGTKVMKTIPDL